MHSGFIEDKEQLEYINKKITGDNVLLGAAGTGKSIIAMALLMKAAQMDNVDNILFLSYNKTLVSFCERYRFQEVAQSTHLFNAPNITIATFHSFFYQTFRSCFRRPPKINQDKLLLRQAIDNCKIRYQNETTEFSKSNTLFASEVKFIEDYGFMTYDEYAEAVRIGQGNKLTKEQRKYYWAVYAEYLNLLRENNYDCDFNNSANVLLDLTAKNKHLAKYQFIIIDEGQDFSPAIIRAIHSLLSENGVFLYIGDSTQEIYGTRLSWKSLGLNIRNKIKRLENNYRNTVEIGNFAKDILNSKFWPKDTEEVLYPKNMVRHGSLPILIDFEKKEIQDYCLDKFINRFKDESTCILTYHKKEAAAIAEKLNNLGIKTIFLKTKEPIDNDAKCFTCTYHSVKGLDFDNVILIDFDSSFIDIIDHTDDKEEKLSLAMKLFYVACTRAKKRLIISSCGKVSDIFPLDSTNYQQVEPLELMSACKENNIPSVSSEAVVASLAEKVLLKKIDLMKYFEKSVTNVKTELDIQSPWMTSRVVDDIFMDKIARLLRRNVVVKILYGIQDDKQTARKNKETDRVVAKLKQEFGHHPNFHLKKGNSHAKKIICDLDYAIIGSFNWLSYTGISDREEEGTIIYNKNEIANIRNHDFNF